MANTETPWTVDATAAELVVALNEIDRLTYAAPSMDTLNKIGEVVNALLSRVRS